MAHFAHYVRRTVVEVNYEDPSDPWFAENQPDNQGFDSPAYHVTRSLTGPAARVSEGDTIWLFSQVITPWGVFPPALDAKITSIRFKRSEETEANQPHVIEERVFYPGKNKRLGQLRY
jgi:hypothetical protein